MNFFLDTGPIFGFCNPDDKRHHKSCTKFFTKHPLDIKNHYTVKKVIEVELNNLRDSRLEENQSAPARDIERKLESVLKLIINSDYQHCPQFNEIFKDLNYFLEMNKGDSNPKDRDAKILAHAFLWDHQNPLLQKPHFITVDRIDICDNRMDIKSIVTKHLATTRMSIFSVKEMVEQNI